MKPTQPPLKFVLFFCHVMALVTPIFAQEGNEDAELQELEKLKLSYTLKVDELHRPLVELNKNYRDHLSKQKDAYQQNGQLKAMLAVEEELETFEAGTNSDLATFPELSRLQQIYREQRGTREEALMEPKRALFASYQKMAADLAANWTKAGKIEAAKAALAEAERFAAMKVDAPVVEQPAPLGSDPANNFEGKAAGDTMKNSLGIELCWIPSGKLTMGSPEDEESRDSFKEAQVEASISQGFWMGKYEVTQAQFKKVMGTNPSSFKKSGEDAPVEKVSWLEAEAFCKALTEQAGDDLPEGWAYRLPTGAQWEYACRAGEEGPFSGGTLDEVGWYNANSEKSTQEVGKKKPNAWGLHDIHGNVREWCRDWFNAKMSGGKDPQGPPSGEARVVRGGCWNYPPGASRAANRGGMQPTEKVYDLGFRVSLSPEN